MRANLTLPVVLLGTVANAGMLWRAEATASAPVSDTKVAQSVSRAVREVSARVTPAVVSVTSRGHRGRLVRGSGVLLSSDGLIVTNYHVTDGASRVHVALLDGRDFVARVVGTDSESDLAVLSLPGEDFPYARLSPEAPPEIGTWVVAVGNPMGLDHTVTFGIISARGRAGIDIAIYEDFLQTDAAINVGNSGGPLIDLSGQVVGINTAKEVNLQGNQGLGFAIPAYMVREVVDEILDKGYVERGWFGIGVRETPMVPSGLASADHVFVTEVRTDSPAQDAGFEVGDVVLAIGGKEVRTSRDVLDSIARLRPGSKVAVDVWRDARTEVLVVDVGKRESSERR